jgi:Zn-dependent peptidase ImmA (M78 family)
MTKKIPKWESELWECISRGDGKTCPTYDCCDVRLANGWCLSDNVDHLKSVLSAEFDVKNYDFMNNVTPGGGKIFRLIEKLANKYLRIAEIEEPPVPTKTIELFDLDHQIEVREVKLNKYRGAIWSFNNKWLIYINAIETTGSKRSTLFHEGFHIAAHTKTIPVFRGKGGGDRGIFNELLADHFSASLLMPRKWVTERWKINKDINEMADIFGVSEQGMWVRLKLLHLL